MISRGHDNKRKQGKFDKCNCTKMYFEGALTFPWLEEQICMDLVTSSVKVDLDIIFQGFQIILITILSNPKRDILCIVTLLPKVTFK